MSRTIKNLVALRQESVLSKALSFGPIFPEFNVNSCRKRDISGNVNCNADFGERQIRKWTCRSSSSWIGATFGIISNEKSRRHQEQSRGSRQQRRFNVTLRKPEKPEHYYFVSWGPKGTTTHENTESHILYESEGLQPEIKEKMLERTSSFEHLLCEANVGKGQSRDDDKLVNDPRLERNWDLWRIILLFRRRVHGDRGVYEVWEGFTSRAIDPPTEGKNADIIWPIFLSMALRRLLVMAEMWKYIQERYKKTGKAWPGLYDKLVGDLIWTIPCIAFDWHRRLYPDHKPRNWNDFFMAAVKKITPLVAGIRRSCFHRLRGIHEHAMSRGARETKEIQVYSSIIPYLMKHSTISEATRYHVSFLEAGDFPENSSPADGLFLSAALTSAWSDIALLMKDFTSRGIPITESTLIQLLKGREQKQEMLEFLFKRVGNGTIPTEAFGDNFWATLLSIQDFDVHGIIDVMAHFGIRRVGFCFLMQLAKRVESREVYDTLASDIRSSGIEVSDELLNEVFFEYKRQSIEPEPPPEVKSAQLYNELLFFHIRRRELHSALHVLTEMRAYGVKVQPNTLTKLIHLILRPRRPGHAPQTVPLHFPKDDIALAISVLTSCLRSGSEVPKGIWKEIFKRLGMTQRLDDLERLALWLADWYHPVRGILTKRRVVSTAVNSPEEQNRQLELDLNSNEFIEMAKIRALKGTLYTVHRRGRLAVPGVMRPESRGNPLRALFPNSFMRAIIEWSFLAMHRRKPVLKKFPGLPPVPAYIFLALKSRLKPAPGEELCKEVQITKFLHTASAFPIRKLPPPDPKLADTTFGLSSSPSQLQKLKSPATRPFPDITWGLRLSLTLACLGAHLDPRTIVSAVSTRARVLYGWPDHPRSNFNVLSQESITPRLNLASLLELCNTIYSYQGYGGRKGPLFSLPPLSAFSSNKVKREEYARSLVMGNELSILKRMFIRCRGVGSGIDFEGFRKGRLTANEEKRVIRIARMRPEDVVKMSMEAQTNVVKDQQSGDSSRKTNFSEQGKLPSAVNTADRGQAGREEGSEGEQGNQRENHLEQDAEVHSQTKNADEDDSSRRESPSPLPLPLSSRTKKPVRRRAWLWKKIIGNLFGS